MEDRRHVSRVTGTLLTEEYMFFGMDMVVILSCRWMVKPSILLRPYW